VFHFWGELKNKFRAKFKNSIGPKNKICLAILFYFIPKKRKQLGIFFLNKKIKVAISRLKAFPRSPPLL